MRIQEKKRAEGCLTSSYLGVSLDRNKSQCCVALSVMYFFFLFKHIVVAMVVNNIFTPVCLISQPLLSFISFWEIELVNHTFDFRRGS